MASWMKTFLFRCRITRMALDAQCDILVAHKETLWTCEISFNSNLLCIYKEVIAMLFGTPSQAHREWHPFRGEHERLSVKLWICNTTCFFMASTMTIFLLQFETRRRALDAARTTSWAGDLRILCFQHRVVHLHGVSIVMLNLVIFYHELSIRPWWSSTREIFG